MREALEETGLVVEIVPTSDAFGFDDPPQLCPPVTIMEEPIGAFGGEDAHHHIDMIYFSRPAEPQDHDGPADGWRWVSRQQLEDDAPIALDGVSERISTDVRALGMAAIDHVMRVEERQA